jgi:hypothetical protein
LSFLAQNKTPPLKNNWGEKKKVAQNVAIRVARTRILLNSIYLTENQKMIFCVFRLKPATFMGIAQKELSRQFLFSW